ncbi:MAG: tetratricopeptide repeat protein [Chloroflexota bacterium]
MTSLAIPHPRPAALLGMAVAIAIASQATSLLLGPARPSLARTPPVESRGEALPAPDAAIGAPDVGLASIDSAIGRWAANIKRDPVDYISATNLGSLYAARARLTGNLDDYARAQRAVEQAIGAASSYTPARVLDATLLYATHDFAAAATATRAILAAGPTQLQALATLGDAELELGDYTGARSAYERLATVVPGAPATARLARLAGLEGDPARALAMADQSISEAEAGGASGAGLAWYRYLAGFVAFQAGNLAVAGSRFEAALADQPGSYLALNGLARVRAAEGRYADAITLDQQAIAIVPQPEFLGELGDLYRLTGHETLAREQYATVRAIAGLAAMNRQVYNRQLVLFDVNHGEHLDEALALAKTELSVRKDVYGYDAYAWALLANGRAAEADQAMAHALSLGTRDALLLYHAGMIARAVGDAPRARTMLADALALNPGFDPLQVVRARAALEELR